MEFETTDRLFIKEPEPPTEEEIHKFREQAAIELAKLEDYDDSDIVYGQLLRLNATRLKSELVHTDTGLYQTRGSIASFSWSCLSTSFDDLAKRSLKSIPNQRTTS